MSRYFPSMCMSMQEWTELSCVGVGLCLKLMIIHPVFVLTYYQSCQYLFFVWHYCGCSQSTNKRRGRNIAVKRTIFLLLQQVCNLIHNFPEYLDVLVSVARKTDSRHWPELFAVAGNSIKWVWMPSFPQPCGNLFNSMYEFFFPDATVMKTSNVNMSANCSFLYATGVSIL